MKIIMCKMLKIFSSKQEILFLKYTQTNCTTESKTSKKFLDKLNNGQ